MDLLLLKKVRERNFEEAIPPEMRFSLVEEFAADTCFGAELIPFQKWGVEGCTVYECRRCLLDPADAALYHCAVCQRIRSYCCGCLDDESAHSLLASLLEKRGKGLNGFQCRSCYWKSKPCTNPSCPNDIGVPTKRCGGCHLDRYCSVECQTAAYPDHVGKCTRIQNKRAAAAEKKAA